MLCLPTARAAEGGPGRDASIAAEARVSEERGDWLSAARAWEMAMLAAERAGAPERALEHAGRALEAWQKVPGVTGRRGAIFALGVISKLHMAQGRLALGRAKNLQALRLIDAWCEEAHQWKPIPGVPAPKGVSMVVLEAWIRGQWDTAMWLDAQGRTIEAVDVLTAADRTARGTAAGQRLGGFYHRKAISTRAGMLKFLGFEERALADYELLERTPPFDPSQPEWARRMNPPYFASQYYGPRPEYLEQARRVWREIEASGSTDRDARRLIAKMAYAYGETGANIADLEAVVKEAKANGATLDAVYAQRDLAVMSAQMGHRAGVEQALLQSLESLRSRGVKRGEPTLYREYGEFLVQEGRAGEGLQMLHEAARMTRAFGWTQHLPRLLMLVIDAQRLAGDLRGTEQTLRELDGLIAAGKLTPHRLFLAHCARARGLLILGRTAEAEEAITRAKAVADAAGLNEFQRFALSWTKDVISGTDAPPASAVLAAKAGGIIDLQPVEILARGTTGQSLTARLRLSNATAGSARGTLTFSGPGATAKQLNEAVEVQLQLDEAVMTTSMEVGVPAGDALPIDVTATATAARSGGLKVEWKSGEETSRAAAHFEVKLANHAEDALAMVSNRSVAFTNPFYAVHLHHPIRVARGVQNLRVQTGAPCRVEIVDARTGAWLGIDANGDGKFTGQGDSLAADADTDGNPDLTGDGETGLGGIEILIFPLAGAPPLTRDLRVDLFALTGDDWKLIGRDTLKPARRR